MQDHTTIETDDEDPKQHYTFIELHNVREDAKGLMGQQKMVDYLSMNGPVEFNPAFEHSTIIDEMLREHVTDYDTVPIVVNKTRVYKPFLADHKPPQTIFVLNGTEAETDVDEDNASNVLAFCWYCEHTIRVCFI